ncbi:MAG: glycosyltransferase [Bacteroidota bacterium]
MIIYIILLCLGIHSVFYIFLFSRLAFYKNESAIDKLKSNKISIVVCFHNEEDNVDRILPKLLKQNAEEIIVVDDDSKDKTLEKLNQYRTDRIKVLSLKGTSPGKKEALSAGFDAASFDTILLTDADCSPSTTHWAQRMTSIHYEFVLGYGPMHKRKGVVALFSRFETYTTALQYLSYALAGIPYMGVGRNMKVNKKTILSQKSRVKGSNLASGDDDLMINAISNRENTGICLHPDSFVHSNPKTSLRSFLDQKTRHISTSVYYKPIHKFLLALFSGTHILFYIALIIALLIGTVSVKLAWTLLLVKWIVQEAINYPVMKKLNESDLFWLFPILDVLFFVYLFVLPIYYFLNKNTSRWS